MPGQYWAILVGGFLLGCLVTAVLSVFIGLPDPPASPDESDKED